MLRQLLKKPTKKQVLLLLALPIVLIMGSAFLLSLFHLRLIKKEPSLLIEDRYNRFVAAFENDDNRFGYWPLPDTLPPKIIALTKAAEDRRFEKHIGVDLKAIGRAFHSNYIDKSHFSGASTVAMQVARMQTGKRNRSLFRKMSEALSAVEMTLVYGREKVLRQYLTLTPYGNRISGINYAARRYYQKPLVDLSWAEVALLVAIPNAPGKMNIYRSDGMIRARKRAHSILTKAFSYNWIDSTTYQSASIELDHIQLPEKELRQENLIHALLAAKTHLLQEGAVRNLNPLNPTIRTTLDKDLQISIQQILLHHMTRLRQEAAGNGAVIVMDRATGEILSYVGSDLYFDDLHDGLIDYASTERSTGSLLKPFIYAHGMEWRGYTPATLLTDINLFFGDGKKTFIPRNYDQKFLGPILYKTALANSRNIPAIQVLEDVGIDLMFQQFRNLKIVPEGRSADYYGLGIAVGNLYTSLYDICGAYLTLANEGMQVSPQWQYGKKDTLQTRIIEKDVALQIQRILSDPISRLPSFPRGGELELPFPVAVKTGTSRGFRDAWTIGWSDRYLVGIWVGRADNKPMKKVSGYSSAAPILKDILNQLHPDRAGGLENVAFAPPAGYKPMMVNIFTGEKATENSAYATMEYFAPGTEPITQSNLYQWIPIDKRNKKLASPWCDQRFVSLEKFVILPEIFKDWAKKQGLNTPPTEQSDLCGTATIIDSFAIQITSPLDGANIYLDPEMPLSFNTLAINCSVKPRANEILWFVDGKELKLARHPYKTNWHMTAGEHTFQAIVPGTNCKSEIITIHIY